MSADTNIRQGDSLNFSFDLGPNVSLQDYTCNIQVKQFPQDTAGINRNIPLTQDAFSGFLTGTETSGLIVGHHNLIADLVKASSDESKEIDEPFQVNTRWS